MARFKPLKSLYELEQPGALTDEEFDSPKHKLLTGHSG
jgi:hypothetical protein